MWGTEYWPCDDVQCDTMSADKVESHEWRGKSVTSHYTTSLNSSIQVSKLLAVELDLSTVSNIYSLVLATLRYMHALVAKVVWLTILILQKLTRPSSVMLGVPSSINDRSVRYMPRYGIQGGSHLHTPHSSYQLHNAVAYTIYIHHTWKVYNYVKIQVYIELQHVQSSENWFSALHTCAVLRACCETARLKTQVFVDAQSFVASVI